VKDGALDVVAALRLPDGRTWAECCTDVQLARRSAISIRTRTVRRHWVGRSRGYSKTSDAAAWTIGALLDPAIMRDGERGVLLRSR